MSSAISVTNLLSTVSRVVLMTCITVASPTLSYDDASEPIKVSLLPNPSHLGALNWSGPCLSLILCAYSEAVNPIALGKTRAKQYSLLKTSPDDCKLGDKAMCVQLHGDASFTGQGVVMECLGLSQCSSLSHYPVLMPVQVIYPISRAAVVCILSWSTFICLL